MLYIQLSAASSLPDIALNEPFRTVIIADIGVPPDNRTAISEWLVESGCLYLMAWGKASRAWQDAVNLANLKAWNFGAIPDQRLVITTSHDKEDLRDVFWFARYTAMHPCAPLDEVMLLHIADNAAETKLAALYEEV